MSFIGREILMYTRDPARLIYDKSRVVRQLINPDSSLTFNVTVPYCKVDP